MQQRLLGTQKLAVSALGLGCMGMSQSYGPAEEQESIATIHRALDLGVNFLDTADIYGPFTNERLVGRAIADRRDQVVLATKFGNERRPDGTFVGVNGRPEYVRQACDASLQRLGVGFVAYSPLGRGFLSGRITSPDDFAPDDFRRNAPRFQGENFARNLTVVERIRELAAAKGVTSGQLAIASVLAQGDDVVPIPGTKRRRYLEENLGALDVELTPDELASIEAVAPRGVTAGDRYAPAMMSTVNG